MVLKLSFYCEYIYIYNTNIKVLLFRDSYTMETFSDYRIDITLMDVTYDCNSSITGFFLYFFSNRYKLVTYAFNFL